MRRLEITRHTVRCPLEDCAATLTVRTDPASAPSRRHRDVASCSLRPPSSYVPAPRIGYFADMAPPMPYFSEFATSPHHWLEVPCSRRCLAVLNAAEPGAGPVPCASGVSDASELVRETQPPAITRLLWLYSV